MKRLLFYTAIVAMLLVATAVAAVVILGLGTAAIALYPAATVQGWPWLLIGAAGVSSAVAILRFLWTLTGA